MELIDILLNLEPGIYVEFSKPFEQMPDHILVRCRVGMWAKDILVNTKDPDNISTETLLTDAVKRAMEFMRNK